MVNIDYINLNQNLEVIYSKLSDFLLVFLVVFIFFKLYARYRDKMVDFAVLLIIAVFSSELIKFFVNKPRPVSNLVFEGSSFPSTHTTIVFSAIIFYLLVCKRIVRNIYKKSENHMLNNKDLFFSFIETLTFMILAFSVSMFRVFSGAHHDSDIIGGIILAFIINFIFLYYDFSIHKIEDNVPLKYSKKLKKKLSKKSAEL